MADLIPVKPGDLITANYFNQVLSSFDSRISALESAAATAGGVILITGLFPAGPVRMGEVITILGQNFGLPAQAIVTIAGVIVTGSSFLPGSSSSALVFQIPPVQGIPAVGQVVTVSVSNPTAASLPYSFTLLPAAITIPTGQIFVNMTGAPTAPTITAGNSYVFVFTITASTSLADTYSLAATLDSASQAAGWTAATVNPGTGSSINQLSIQSGQNITAQVGIMVTIPATAGVASGQVTLTVTSSINPTGLFGSGLTTVNVGAAPPPPNAINITIAGVTVRTPAGLPAASNSGNTSITLPHGTTSAVVTLSVLVPNTASTTQYICTAPTFAAAGWVASVLATDSTFFGQSTAVTVHVNVTTIPIGPASTVMTFQIQESGNATVAGQIAPTILIQ